MTLRARLDQVRRRLEERADQAWALARHRLGPLPTVAPFDGEPRFALVTVNFSTTAYLKLLLLTLAEQKPLELLLRIVVVDNRSRDGGAPFLRALAARVPRIALAENRTFLSHARGMRRGLALLDELDRGLEPKRRANIVLSCDTDVVLRREDTLAELGARFVHQHAAIAGELRRGVYPHPEAQASFVAVRRDCYARRDLAPWVNHGAPAYWLQKSAWRAGLNVVDFPTYRDGYALHRGRAGVAAARTFAPSHSYASVETGAHYMGVPDGARLWDEIATRWSRLLLPEAEPRLIAHLAERLA